MTNSSKAGVAVVAIFGLVFLGFGAVIGEIIFTARGPAHGNLAATLALCSIFAVIGGGLIVMAVQMNRKINEQIEVEQQSPGSPWLWRKDWAASRAYGTNSQTAIGLDLFAGLWNLIAITVAAGSLPQYFRTSDPRYLGPLLFVAAGLVLAFFPVRAAIRRKRFGKTCFQFASLPFSPGKPLRGTIHLRFNTTARHGINLRLSCVRQIVTGAGNNRSTSKVVLWQSEKNVSEQSITPSPMGDAAIPVDFTIPRDAYETNCDDSQDQVLWSVHGEADTPGVSFSDDFEIPVFRLTPQPETAGSVGDPDTTASAGFQSDAGDVPPPDNPKVVVGAGANGGKEFYFPTFRNPVRVLVLTLLTAVWTGVVYFLGHSQAPVFFQVVFGLFDVLLVYGVLQSALGSSRIEAGDGKIVLSRTFVGIGTTREIPYSDSRPDSGRDNSRKHAAFLLASFADQERPENNSGGFDRRSPGSPLGGRATGKTGGVETRHPRSSGHGLGRIWSAAATRSSAPGTCSTCARRTGHGNCGAFRRHLLPDRPVAHVQKSTCAPADSPFCKNHQVSSAARQLFVAHRLRCAASASNARTGTGGRTVGARHPA